MVEVNDTLLELAERVRPQLIQDGMFLVGLDIVAGRLMEINVFSPGGLNRLSRASGVDFCGAIIQALERKVDHSHHHRRDFDNRTIATL